MAQWHRNIQDIITIIDACIRAQQESLHCSEISDAFGAMIVCPTASAMA